MDSSIEHGKMVTGYLKRIVGNPVGELLPLSGCEVTIGRVSSSDICIPHVSISRNHCKLKYINDGWVICDNGGVNGVYLDGIKIRPQLPQPLKKGTGIYLGLPEEASAAFIFLENKNIDGPCNASQENLASCSSNHTSSQRNDKVLTLNKRSKPACRTGTEIGSRQKRKASVTPDRDNEPQYQSDHNCDEANNSDSSISSLDSLRTRIKKMSSKKKGKGNPTKNRHCSTSLASRSASPVLKQSSSKSRRLENAPSTSKEVELDKIYGSKGEKPGVFKELDQLLNEQSDSCQDAADLIENSESLLNDSIPFLDCDPYPFSQPIEGSPIKKKNKVTVNKENKELNTNKKQDELKEEKTEKELEELKKVNVHLVRKNVAQRQKLNQMFEEMRAKESSTVKISSMLEEELICNICTEVFIKATTLGCSHTFCEHCISVWKKKQKRCPICRKKIESETRVLIMDNFIDKVVEQLDHEYQEKRKEVIASRDAAKLKEKAPKRRKKSTARSRRRVVRPPTPEIEEISVLDSSYLSDEVESEESESSMEGHGYYGGYGHCYICGHRGHWSNGCPYR